MFAKLLVAVGVATLLGTGAAGGSEPPDPAAEYALYGSFHLPTGKTFGTADYDLRASETFCATQRRVTVEEWTRRGAERRGEAVVWLDRDGYYVRFQCIPVSVLADPYARWELLRAPLPESVLNPAR